MYVYKGIGKYKVSVWSISGAGAIFLDGTKKRLEANKMEEEKQVVEEQVENSEDISNVSEAAQTEEPKTRAVWTREMKEEFIRNRLIKKMSLKQISDKMALRLTQVKGMQKYYKAGALDDIVTEMFDEDE